MRRFPKYLLALPIIYVLAVAAYHAVVTSYYKFDRPKLYRFVDTKGDFQHYVYTDGRRCAVYRGMISEEVGEYAVQSICLEKWRWYFPRLYDKPDGFFIFGLRIVDRDCTPTTMYWENVCNETVNGCKAHYDDRRENHVSFMIYPGKVIIGDLVYEEIDEMKAVGLVKKFKSLFKNTK